MISVKDAIRKFASKLELTQGEQNDASRRQKEIREHLNLSFQIDHDFLTGSYRRWTKTKPLKDVDIFCCLGEEEQAYRNESPHKVLDEFEEKLADKYGSNQVRKQRRSVCVEFDVAGQENRVMSFDVVPSFPKKEHYEIPDTMLSGPDWIETDPKVHEELAVEANKAYSGEWKRMVRMVKKWNEFHEKPIKPSFLIEVMALELLVPDFGGDYRREHKAFFASLADRIHEDWPDPAGLGPPVSDVMDDDRCRIATQSLNAAETSVAHAIDLERRGKNGEALRIWRDKIFGDLFPLS